MSDASAVGAAAPRPLGVFGGTFDPVHLGHLSVAWEAAELLDAEVRMVPANVPPHRPAPMASAAERVAMLRVALRGQDRLTLDTRELERSGPSYTVDSLAQLRTHLGAEVGLVLVMAADSFSQIETWRDPDRLLELAEWAVGPRPGTAMPDPAALRERFGAKAARIHLLEGPSLDLSSSEIRSRVAARRPIRYLVPRAVEELIDARGLYRRRRP